MAKSAEELRVEFAEKTAKDNRAKELARREAHRSAVKRAQVESVISHGPVR